MEESMDSNTDTDPNLQNISQNKDADLHFNNISFSQNDQDLGGKPRSRSRSKPNSPKQTLHLDTQT